MIFAILLALSGLTLSAVAIYFSVIGLSSIFAAAFWPIVVMGTTLEISKLVAASWLKAYWHEIPALMKWYMTLAVIVLMLITSMGIFGYLSKAHSEQSVPVGDNQARIQIIDERIAIEQEVIAQARQDIDVLNQQIERFTELGAVSRGVTARNQQREERQALTQQVIQAQDRISEMRSERAPYAATLRVIEAEIGPIKYIAKLIYGDNPDANLLEKAVIWVTLIIVFVFDPLAILMLLSAQMTYKWHREKKAEGDSLVTESGSNIVEEATVTTTPWPFMAVVPTEVQNVQTDRTTAEPVEDTGQPVRHEPSLDLQSKSLSNDEPVGNQTRNEDDHGPVGTDDEVEQFQEQSQELTEDSSKKKLIESSEQFRLTKEQLDALDNLEEWHQAKTDWKEDNPNLSLKLFKQLYLEGKINKLPWEDYVGKSQTKKTYIMKDKDQQVTLETVTEVVEDTDLGYIQNEEQKNQTALWKSIRPKDE